MKKLLLFAVSLLLISNLVFTQDKTSDETKTAKQLKKEQKAAKKAEKLAQGKFMISPVGAPAYTPELGAMIAVGGLTSFKTNSKDSLILRSSFPFTAGYSATGALVANGILTSYWFADKLRINADLWYKDMPDHYWGTGYEKGYNTPKTDSTTAYDRLWWWINPRFLYQFKKNYFLGLNVDINYTQGSNVSRGVENDPDYQAFADKPLNTGLGLIARYDSRDVPVDAREGVLFDFRATFFSTSFGGDNQYQIYLIDYKQFQTIGREGITLAWQLKARIGAGDVPYGEMSMLGTPFDLRGYTWGRYRDESMFLFLTELRYTFLKTDGSLSKHGVVGWIGSGTVFNVQTLKDNDNRWLPNFGVGYRFELQPRMNLRMDYGIGRETSGFYFNFNQAF